MFCESTRTGLFHGQPNAEHDDGETDDTRQVKRTLYRTQPAETVEYHSNQHLTGDDGDDRCGYANARNHVADRGDHHQPKDAGDECVPWHAAPLSELSAADEQERQQGGDRSTDVDDEDALESAKPLGHHTGERTLQANGDSACQADQDNEEEGVHGGVLLGVRMLG